MPPPVEPRGGVQSTLGSIGVVVGILGLAGGGVAALMAKLTYDSSNARGQCGGDDTCTKSGLDKRDSAFLMGDFATAGVIGGAVFLASGIVLTATTPRTPEAAAPAHAVRLAPTVGRAGAGLSLQGTW